MPPTKQSKLGFAKTGQSTSSNAEPIDLDPQEPESQSQPSQDLTDATPDYSAPATPGLPLPKSRKRKQVRTAWVFKWMRDGVDMQHVFHNKDGKEEWRCKICLQTYQLSGGNHAIKRHLNEYHDIFEDSPADKRAKNIQIDIQNAMATAANNPQKRRKLSDSDGGELPLDGDVIEVLYVKFLVACNIRLRLVECSEFRAFVSYLNKDVDRWLNTSHNTIHGWVMRQFKVEKERVKLRLQNARTKIHVSLDIWTSPNNKPILGVTAVYIGEDGELEHTVLAVKEIEGTHEGENLAPVVMAVIEDWQIAEKLGYFVMDNATNNDTMMRAVSRGKPTPPILRVFC